MTIPELPDPGEPQEPGLLLRLIRDQRVAFLLVGAVNTVVGYGFFVAADLTLGRWLDEVANTVVGSVATLLLAHVLGTLWAFTLYRRLVFRVRGHVLIDLLRFESVYLVALGINVVTLPVLVELGIDRLLAQALILLATTVLSYLGHRYFSFRRPPPVEPAAHDEPRQD